MNLDLKPQRTKSKNSFKEVWAGRHPSGETQTSLTFRGSSSRKKVKEKIDILAEMTCRKINCLFPSSYYG